MKMKLFGIQHDIIKSKTRTIFIHGGHFNQETTFMQIACVAGCVQSFMVAQKCKIGISEFWQRLTFLYEQQIKSVLILNTRRAYFQIPY